MSGEDNQAIVRRAFEEIWNAGNLDLADDLYAPNHCNNDPVFPSVVPGPEGISTTVAVFRAAFPDLQFTIEDLFAVEDRVVSRWTAQGTHAADLKGIGPIIAGVPATQKHVTVKGMSIARVEDGKIQESWNNWDALGLMRQLGVFSSGHAVDSSKG